MLTIFTVVAIGIVLFCCLNLVESQNVSIARCQTWHACIPVLEAGIEEAMAHLNNPASTNLVSNGWSFNRGLSTYTQERSFGDKPGDSYYSVSITLTNALEPVITSSGYVRVPLAKGASGGAAVGFPPPGILKNEYLSRSVRVLAKKTPLYVKAMAARERITMNGNNITTDSFDSRDPNYSTFDGHYDPTKIKDNGDVSTASGLTNMLSAGNANIKGRLRTGPGGTTTIGSNGKVGSLAWHASNSTGVEPGWLFHDVNMTFSPVQAPFKSAPSPSQGTLNGVSYNYVLGSTNYEVPTINLSGGDKIAVVGNAVLLVDGDVSISGTAEVDIIPPGSLTMYVAGANASIAGVGINNTGWATNFMYYGLPSNKNLTMQSNGEFTGSIYAPDTDLRMSGGGSGIMNFIGACIMKNITVNGHYNFHYDEALGKYGPKGTFVIVNWVEL